MAYFGITGMSDGTCPWVSSDAMKRGGKYCVLTHAEDNGCTVPGNIQTAMVGSKKYLCYDFEGCDDNHPVKVCTFNGGHQAESSDSTSNNWIPDVSWEFFTQF
jgi:hypothetical protein